MIVHPHAPIRPSDAELSNIATLDAIYAARPIVEELSRETDRTVGLTVWGNLGPTLIWWCESSQPLETQLRCGLVVSMLGSASGAVFCAFASREVTTPFIERENAEAVKGGKKPRFGTRDQFERWRDEVQLTRLGSMINSATPGIHDALVTAFSAPVFDSHGEIVLAIVMMGPGDSFHAKDPAVSRLQETADALSARLGHVVGPAVPR